MSLTCFLPFLATKGWRVLEEKVNETEVSYTVFSHLNFSRALGGVVGCVNVKPSARARLNHGLRDAQNVCALTKVGTVLKKSYEKTSDELTFGRGETT